eukprot:4695112-Alexandrium_andersonii.AAC.1
MAWTSPFHLWKRAMGVCPGAGVTVSSTSSAFAQGVVHLGVGGAELAPAGDVHGVASPGEL